MYPPSLSLRLNVHPSSPKPQTAVLVGVTVGDGNVVSTHGYTQIINV